MAKKSQSKINPTLYSVSVSPLAFPNMRDVRKEYARLRSIAAKRLKRLEASRYAGSKAYKNYVNQIKPLAKTATEAQARRALADVARFLSLKTSTVSGQKSSRDKQLKTMREEEYNFLNESNIDDFRDYMDIVMSYKTAQSYDSDSIVDLFEMAEDYGVDPLEIADDFADYLDEQGAVVTSRLEELSKEDKEALEDMESDELKEPIPVEIEGARKPEKKRKKSAVEKRAEKLKEKSIKNKRIAAKKKRRK